MPATRLLHSRVHSLLSASHPAARHHQDMCPARHPNPDQKRRSLPVWVSKTTHRGVPALSVRRASSSRSASRQPPEITPFRPAFRYAEPSVSATTHNANSLRFARSTRIRSKQTAREAPKLSPGKVSLKSKLHTFDQVPRGLVVQLAMYAAPRHVLPLD